MDDVFQAAPPGATDETEEIERLEPELRPEEWQVAKELLRKLLFESDGCVSSTALRKELERKGVEDPRALVVKLRNWDETDAASLAPPDFRYSHRGRSFYTEEALERLDRETEEAAARAERTESSLGTPSGKKRQEEARLVTYVQAALEDVYWTDYGPEDKSYVFDVHNDRPGGDLENVDLLAVHWRSNRRVDLISVEVKLELSGRLAHQALSYRRFSDRVWVAVPVSSDVLGAGVRLREQNPRTFDYLVEQGIGVLACRRAQGRSYEVFPIHWPQRVNIDPVERDLLLERHRGVFEQAGVLSPKGVDALPIF